MVVQSLHDLQLTKDLFVASLLLHYKLLAHSLDCIQRTCIFLARQVDLFSETALTDDFYLIKVLHSHHLRLRTCLTCGFQLLLRGKAISFR